MLLGALVLALPAAGALAQSAGDDQYQDPLGGNSSSGPQQHSSTPSHPAQSGSGSSGTSTPAASAQAPKAQRSAAPRSVPLARTGFPVWIPGGAGLLLAAGGLLLLLKKPRRTS
jgi:hypothetical protein